jgi:hypothetical protein
LGGRGLDADRSRLAPWPGRSPKLSRQQYLQHQCVKYDDTMDFRDEITLSKDEAFDLAGALHMPSVELRRNGVFELAHRLDGSPTGWKSC